MIKNHWRDKQGKSNPDMNQDLEKIKPQRLEAIKCTRILSLQSLVILISVGQRILGHSIVNDCQQVSNIGLHFLPVKVKTRQPFSYVVPVMLTRQSDVLCLFTANQYYNLTGQQHESYFLVLLKKNQIFNSCFNF